MSSAIASEIQSMWGRKLNSPPRPLAASWIRECSHLKGTNSPCRPMPPPVCLGLAAAVVFQASGLRQEISARLSTGVEPAFFFRLVFPPPATLAFVLAGEDGTGTGLAADRHEATFVEGIVGDIMLADICPNLF